MKPRVHPLVYAGVFLLCGATLALEVCLTRILSLMLWHHFTYLVIGIALLGLGASGSILARREIQGAIDTRPPEQRLARYALAFAVLVPVAYVALTRVRIAPESFRDDLFREVVSLLLVYGLIAAPFFLAGFAICTVLSAFSHRVGSLYFADLLGAGLGVGACLATLEDLTGPGAIFALGALSALAAACFALSDLARRPNAAACAHLGLAAAWALFTTTVLLPQARDRAFDPPLAPTKELAMVLEGPHPIEVEVSRWNPLARIDVTREFTVVPQMGGRFGPGTPPWPLCAISQDGSAPTSFLNLVGQEPRDMAFLGTASAGIGYVALEARGARERAEALVIGVGGGVDLLIGLHWGVARIVGAEINSTTVDLLRDQYAAYLGGLVQRPEIELVWAEGRHYAAHAGRRFHLVQMSGVDSYSALSSGAQVLSESYLYTTEAVETFLDALHPEGFLSYSRMFFPERPRESLRLVATVAESLAAQGYATPARHVFFAGAGRWSSLLVSKTPFEAATLVALRAFCAANGYPVLFDPETPADNVYHHVLRADGAGRRTLYASYPFRIEPATDDRPFFFNYFRWRSVLDEQSYGGHVYESTFPTGMAALLVGLIQTVVLGAYFILRPVWGLRGSGTSRGRRLAGFAFFAALGVGFIAFEIVLMQRLVLYLGHPTYSLSVVLGAMLVFAGLGSLTITANTDVRRRLRWLAILIPAAILGGWWLVDLVIDRTLGQGLETRMALTVAVLAVPSFVMGQAFPSGIRILSETDPRLVPWGWAVNGFTTVFGSTATVVIAMELGFSRLVFAVAPLYFLGIAWFLLAHRERESAT